MGDRPEFDPEDIPNNGAVGDSMRELLLDDERFKRLVDPPRDQNHSERDPIPAIDLQDVYKLAALLSTQEHIAAYLGMSKRTFKRYMDLDPRIREAWEQGRANMERTLLRRMVRIGFSRRADAGRMCIWLSKNVLGFSDKVDVKDSTGRTPGMTQESKRAAMAELMGEDPANPMAGLKSGE